MKNSAQLKPVPESTQPAPRKRGGLMARILGDMIHVARTEKKWWLLPLAFVVLGLIGLMIFAAATGPLAPFIYPLL